jgi:hypothetical protein
MTIKCRLWVGINTVVAFDSHAATPTLELTAKWAAKLKALIVLKIADRHWNYHGRILIHFLLSSTEVSGGCLER